MKSCGTCVHFKRIDMTQSVMDPEGVYNLCTWKPLGPFWVLPLYLSQFPLNPAAVRKPADGAQCEVWERGAA